MTKWAQLANAATIEKTIKALKANGIEAEVVENGHEAKQKVLELVPKDAEVFTVTSQTLEACGINKEINESGNYESVRNILYSPDKSTKGREIQKTGSAPDWVIGSVHAVTVDGQVLIASNSGSQLPAYSYGSTHVIWVVGAQKIVKNMDDGIKRIYEHSLPLEDERAQKAYGIHSGVSKLLIINREKVPNRIHLIFIKQNLGF